MSSDKRLIDRAYSLHGESKSEDVLQLYEDWADVYDAELDGDLGYIMPQRCARAVAEHAGSGPASILDVGCGTGLSGEALKREGYSTIDGCDFSPAMLARARARAIYDRLFEADLTRPPMDVADGAYDIAAAVGVFSYAHIPPAAADEILRCVKPGGLFVIGLNDHFFSDGTFGAKLAHLEASGAATVVFREHGPHIPKKSVEGWVFVLEKAGG